MSGIERRRGCTVEEFEKNYLDELVPVVLTDAVDNWGRIREWTPEYLSDRCGHRKVTLGGETIAFAEHLKRVQRSTPQEPALYLVATSVLGVFPELIADILPYPEIAHHNWFRSRYMPACVQWGIGREFGYPEILVGGAGGRFPVLHYDVAHLHAFVVQLYGEKEFFLCPPEQTEYVYPDPERLNDSLVRNIHQPDLERFPLFAHAKFESVVLKPGEMIFIPSGYWHVTRMLSTSIGFTFNTLSASNWDAFVDDVVVYLSAHEPQLAEVYNRDNFKRCRELIAKDLGVDKVA